MKSKPPIYKMIERVNQLEKNEFFYLDTIKEYDPHYEKDKIFKYCVTSNHQSEFKTLCEKNKTQEKLSLLTTSIESLLDKILVPYPDGHPLYWLHTKGEKLSSYERARAKELLMEELECHALILEIFLGARIFSTTPPKASPPVKSNVGRKKAIANFKGKNPLSQEKLQKLFDFVLKGRNKDQLFRESDEARHQFYEIMQSVDVSQFDGKGYMITLDAEPAIFAFMLTWLESNSYLESPFLAVENSKSFYRDNKKPLNANTLSKAKSTHNFEKYITPIRPIKEVDCPNNPTELKQYFPYLNYRMHEVFKKK